ncbi:MAG: agmatinase [Desulfobulbaceae bacterium]|nr:agmatinase [Desulfobulbaceae bacterium]
MDSAHRFLDSEAPHLAADQCLFQVIPAPYEKTVSYGGGTAQGPSAIILASGQLEAYDGASCPCEQGIHTLPPAPTLQAIESAVAGVAAMGKIPVLLGGEHTVTYGALKALRDAGETFGVIQFDAHADLRDTYEGDPFSHACVMRRALDMDLPLLQIGVRALSPPEVELRKNRAIHHYDADLIGRHGLPSPLVPADFPQKVYITFDVDGLDPSIMAATGTPEPGGLTWWQAMDCLAAITSARTVIGFDVVELAPIKDLHAPDFTAARLVYNLMGYITRARATNKTK